jgi:hypothetical protein
MTTRTLVIRNDLRVADIYLGDSCLRSLWFASPSGGRRTIMWIARLQPSYLTSDPSWQEDYFTPATDRFLRRRYFAKT